MKRVFVCTNLRQTGGQPSCAGRGSVELLQTLQTAIESRQLDCEVKASVCFGHCDKGPNIKVLGEPFMHGVTVNDIDSLLDEIAQ